jgi:hypothetical protein
MTTQGWPLWAVSDEGDERNIYAVVGWEDRQPVGIMIGGEAEAYRTAETLLCPLAFFGELGAARQAASVPAGDR